MSVFFLQHGCTASSSQEGSNNVTKDLEYFSKCIVHGIVCVFFYDTKVQKKSGLRKFFGNYFHVFFNYFLGFNNLWLLGNNAGLFLNEGLWIRLSRLN